MAEIYRTTLPTEEAVFGSLALAKDNRVIATQYSWGSENAVVCLDKLGNTLWSYPTGAGSVNAVLATTDNLVYVTVTETNPYVLALTQDGAFVWRYNFTTGSAPRTLSEMRIFGGHLLVGGTGRTVANGTGPRTVLISLDRFTGNQNFAREYLVNGTPYNQAPVLRSGGGSAFMLVKKTPSIAAAVLKVSPTNGDLFGTYAVGGYRVEDMQVDSAGYTYLVGRTSNVPDLRRINSTGTGTFPLVYRKTHGDSTICLSGGALYTARENHVLKIKLSDGSIIWDRDFFVYPGPNSHYFKELKADSQGRIFARYQTENSSFSSFYMAMFDPTTGAQSNEFHVKQGSNELEGARFAINAYSELTVIGQNFDGVLKPFAIRIAQPMQVNNDVYEVIEGQTLVTNGNGLLANDRYANPAYAETRVVQGSGPGAGTLSLALNGELSFTAKDGFNNPLPRGPQTFRYIVTRGSTAIEANVTINVVQGPLLLQTVGRYAGFGGIAGTVVLSSNGLPTAVALTSDHPLIVVPPTATAPTTSRNANFTAQVLGTVTSDVTVTFTARVGSFTVTKAMILEPLKPKQCYFIPSTVTGGQTANLRIMLNGKAGPGGFEVTITESDPYLTAPTSVTVPQGLYEVYVQVQTTTPPSQHNALVTVTGGGGTASRSLVINP